MTIGNKIRSLREEKGMTQQELANKIGKSRAAVGKYEIGSRLPDNSTLHAICDYFETSTDYLLGRSDFRRITPASLEDCLSERYDSTFRGKLLSLREKSALLKIIDTIFITFSEERDHS